MGIIKIEHMLHAGRDSMGKIFVPNHGINYKIRDNAVATMFQGN